MADCLSPRSVICAKGAGRLRKESGVTVLMVAVAMFALLSMAIISLDVVNVYMASNQAQRTADAAALAGAEALASSGTTSNPSSVPLSSVCDGSTGDADLRAQAVAAQNRIAGLPPTTVTTSCPSTTPPSNPQIRVAVTRTGIPTFFARMWGNTTSAVSATAVAEAYNPSYDPANPLPSRPPIAIHGIKPWLVYNNCSTSSCSQPFFFTLNYAIANGGSFIDQPWTLTLIDVNATPGGSAGAAQFYALNGPAPLACPATTAVWGTCSRIAPDGYHDNIACENGFNFGNGQVVPNQVFQVDTRLQATLQSLTASGTECLIHASDLGLGQGQDSITIGPPVTITGGSYNPNKSLQGVKDIHRSDSVITVPVFNCPSGPTCNGTAPQLPIVGFLQLGIQDVSSTTPGVIDAVILNAAGLDPSSAGTPITGAGTSPVAVRLINP